tara:strand:- start:1437 stop:1652 length:216 start_codon:yes stop_codon:yes gene_type:complete
MHNDFTKDIVHCSACNKGQERYLHVQENSKYLCVACWLKDANNFRANQRVQEQVEQYQKEYRTKYFSSHFK